MEGIAAQPLTEPTFECLTVEMVPDAEPAELEARARRALAEVVGDAEGWRVVPVHPAEPHAFDLVPPDDGRPTVAEAWDATYALQRRAEVVDAEPSFEILQDDVEETPPHLAAAEAALFADAAATAAEFSEDDPEWSPKLVSAPQAWALDPPPGGMRRGEGIVVGHPDSGFVRHREIFDGQPGRFLAGRGFDFVDRDPDAEDEDGGHGLGTASVLMSAEGSHAQGFVTGTAPAASIIPYRVAKKRPVVPVPVLFRSGMRRLRQAVDRAVGDGCHVISISLGWLPNRSLHRAIRRAVEAEVIVVAAAGNLVPFVVWPAHYTEVVAVAGCTARRRVWLGSSAGPRVAVSAPARNVWKAARDGAAEGVVQSDGTSFAAASTAGVAALWLAHHGRAALLARYGGELRLATVFRRLLGETTDPPPLGHGGMFGKGIVNAERLLAAPLPTVESLRASSAFAFEAAALAGEGPAATAGFEAVADALDAVSRTDLRTAVGRLVGVEEDELDRRLRGVGPELAFHVLTTPALREGLIREAGFAAPPALSLEAALPPAGALAPAALHEGLAGLPELSERLRSRLAP